MFTWEPLPDLEAGKHAGSTKWEGFPWSKMAIVCAITLFASYLFYLVQLELSFALAELGVTGSQHSGML